MSNLIFLGYPKKGKEKKANRFGKIIVTGIWFVTPGVFNELSVRRQGVATVDKNALEKDWKAITSKYIGKEALRADAIKF